ncbi:MAG: hypothetical protein R2704_04910 [Microthrixaceae bacterium]
MSALCEAMGRSADDRLVIFTADGLGRSHAANEGSTRRCVGAWPPRPG